MYFMNVLMVLKLLPKNSLFRIHFPIVFFFHVFHIALNINLQTFPTYKYVQIYTL